MRAIREGYGPTADPNPFASFSSIFNTPAPTPPPHEELGEVSEETFPVSIPCKVCGDPCLRSWQEAGAPWVHTEERIYINTLRNNYDHQAQPDYIDAEVIEDDHNRSSDRPVSGGPAPGVPTWVHRNP